MQYNNVLHEVAKGSQRCVDYNKYAYCASTINTLLQMIELPIQRK